MLYHNALVEELNSNASYLVDDYFIRKSMANLGYKQDFKELSDFEVKYLSLIDQTLTGLRNDKNRSSS